jgi:type II secretory pathway pseudopilin PulG
MTCLSTVARAAGLGAARRRGVTLIEAVLYISIALALIVGGLVFFQQASLAQRTNSAVRNISAIASEVRGLYQGSISFANLEEVALIRAGAVPSSMVDGTTLVNEWGGTVSVRSSIEQTNGAQTWRANSGFSITYENVPEAACVRLTNADITGTGRAGSGIRAIGFSAPTYSAPASPGPITGVVAHWAFEGDLTPDNVALLCRGAANLGTTVDINYWFDR